MAMWASMVLDESLVARTFGTYFTKMIGIDSGTVVVAGLGVVLLIGSFAINAAGSGAVNTVENVMAVVKIGRAIVIAIAIAIVVYLAVALAVRGNLGLGEIADARDFALAQSAQPVFGSVGFNVVAALAVIATVTSVMHRCTRRRGCSR